MADRTSTFHKRLNDAMSYRNIKQSDLVQLTGMSKQKISQYVNGQFEAKQKGIYELAKALNVDEAWLMGYDVPMEANYNNLTQEVDQYENFTKVDKKDIAASMVFLIDQLNRQDALMFDGEPLDEESKELLKTSLENSMKMGKLIAKQKYTPKKYKKD